MVMPGEICGITKVSTRALEDGSLDIRELKRCVYHTVKIILQSIGMRILISYEDQFK